MAAIQPSASRPFIIDATDFLPTPTQDAFISDVTTRVKGLIGGLGSGKTRTGAEAFSQLIYANPRQDFLMAGPSHEMTHDLCVPAFLEAMPSEMIIKYDVKYSTFHLHGGRKVKCGSADKPSTLEGRNLAGFWADEARYWKKQSWLNLIARIRHKAARRIQGIVTTTPAMGWLSDEFDAGKPNRSMYRVSTRENAHNLDPGYIKDLESSYSPRLAASLIDGQFKVIEGQVYEEWDEARHLVDVEPRPAWRTVLWWDFGARHSAVVIAQVTGEPLRLADGRVLPARSVIAMEQVMAEGMSTERLIPIVMAKLGRHLDEGQWIGGLRVDAVYCDPAGNQRGLAVETHSVALLRSAFGYVVRYYTDVVATHIPDGVWRVAGALSPVDGSAPRLYVRRQLAKPEGRAEKERGIVKMFGGLRYPEKGTGLAADQPVKDGVLDHVGDAVRYGVTGHSRDDWAVSAPPRNLGLVYDADEG